MKVYVVEHGCYEDRGVSGVYATPEAAMAAHPPRVVTEESGPDAWNIERPGGWQPDGEGEWENGLDWHEHGTITEYEVRT